MRSPRTSRLLPALAAIAFAAGLWLLPGAAGADDTDLVSVATGKPYVFLVFDTSGSMNWSPKCTAEQVAAGICDFLCPTGDCPVPRDGDDPASKFRQAKEALYEVIGSLSGIDFGFASFNQDQLGVNQKHWLYTVSAAQAGGFHTLSGSVQFPLAGSQEVFGRTIGCDRGNGGDFEVACYGNNPADLNDAWEVTKARRLPKSGMTNGATVSLFIRTPNSTRYRVEYRPNTTAGNTLGNPTFLIDVATRQCAAASNDCSSFAAAETVKTITYDRVGDFIMWDYQVSRDAETGGWFGYQDATGGGTCEGWDTNVDTPTDHYPDNGGYNLRFPTVGDIPADPDRTPAGFLDYGDRIPLDWLQSNHELIKRRFSPDNSGAADSFGSATFLNDVRIGAEGYLRLKDELIRPLVPLGSTPLGYALSDFRDWYCEEEQASRNCKQGGGWLSIAQRLDPSWGCRQKYLIIVTDGDDTCPGRDPCSYTASLRAQTGILSYVVAFGVENSSGNKLNCMAANGGTGDPIYPQNKQELVQALRDIFREVQERTATFAAAAVPTVQSTVADKIFLSNFTPVRGKPIWSGRLQTFLKPLPLDENNVPDTSVRCGGSIQSRCYLWDAGDVQYSPVYNPTGLLLQAPTFNNTPNNNTALQIGDGPDQRRVFYRNASTLLTPSNNRRLFQFPAPADELDLWNGMEIDAALSTNQRRAAAADAIAYLLKEKSEEITNPLTGLSQTITYVLGDIFHSDPVPVDGPSSLRNYTEDPYGSSRNLCTSPPSQDPARAVSPSYRTFAQTHRCRRKMVLVSANDGQLHAFDAGQWQLTECSDDAEEIGFTNGTGKELFSFIPREALPTVYSFKDATRHTWSVDGRIRIADVFIDPVNNGTPACLEREWRTVAFGTMREGGRSLFALDITQPDEYDVVNGTSVPDAATYVPSCMQGGAGCGTLPFPAVLWEFEDRATSAVGAPRLDEDNSGLPDLGETWSPATVGRIRVCTSGCGTVNAQSEDRFVAVFGGGLGENPGEVTGNYLYMVDVETGKVIYKRWLDGGSPATAAAVDTDRDGYFDRIYTGTVNGWLYKVDLGRPTNPLPLVASQVRDYSTPNGGVPYTLRDVVRIADTRANPFKIFYTNGRPIYMETSVIFVAQLRTFALAFGTGNRWDLWDASGQDGRFYLIVDENFADANNDLVADPCDRGPCSSTGYRTEADYIAVDPDTPFSPGTPDYLLQATDPDTGDPTNPLSQLGWYFTLYANEKVTTDPFAFGGILSFTAYNPVNTINADNTCSRTGFSRIFVVQTTSGAGYVFPDPNDLSLRTRYQVVGAFTTQPFVEQSATKNPYDPTRPPVPGTTADELCTTVTMARIREELKRLAPADCRFNNLTQDVKSTDVNTGLVCIAPVPECVAPHAWKEF